MKGALATALAASTLLAGSAALQLAKRESPRVVGLPIERRQTSKPIMSQRSRKRNTVSETLDNFEDGSLYFANVTMGTPAQKFRFHIDTGSSDLWTNSAGSSLCSQDADAAAQGDVPCSTSGTYDANSSSTYEYVNSLFEISYADGTGASGDYVKDTLRFNTMAITGQQFGIGYKSSSSEGVMGIGYPKLEVAVQVDRDSAYQNIPQKMVSQGLIGTPAYSLWLDSLSSLTGNILFGGVDSDKYVGSLKTLPIVQEEGTDLEMIVALDTVSIVDGSSNTTVQSSQINVLLDSGSTLSYLPTKAADAIYSKVGATYDAQQSVAVCNCDLSSSSTTLDFIFGGKVISVAMSELVLEGGTGSANSDTGCVFGVIGQDSESSQGSNSSSASYTLGDSFIRNAYVVYDLQNNEISLAQTNFKSKSTDIHEITNTTSATSAPSGVAAEQAKASGSAAAPMVPPWAGLAGAGLLLAAAL